MSLRYVLTICLELRSLPSAGVTRFPRYYEPLRHPRAPGLSLTASVQLVLSSPDLTTLWGFPCCVRFPCVRCCRHYPGAATGRRRRFNLTQPYQPSPITLSGRPAHRPFRGSAQRSLALAARTHSRGHLYVTPSATPKSFSHFVTSMTAPVASGWSGCRGGACTRLESAALARRIAREADIADRDGGRPMGSLAQARPSAATQSR